MCTIVILNQVHPDLPVVIAANREEFLARPTSGAQVLLHDPIAVGGRDLQAGGTWMGATSEGLFVGLTNQRSYEGNLAGLRSRGDLVIDALATGSVTGVGRLLEATRPADYNSFNLLYGDAGGLQVAHGRRETDTLEIEVVPAGVSVLSNDGIDTPNFPKVARAHQLAAPLVSRPWPELVESLHALLADHELPPPESLPEPPPGSQFDRATLSRLQALCVHAGPYGTRSSTIIALEPGGVTHYLFGEGPPCQSELEDTKPLLGADPVH